METNNYLFEERMKKLNNLLMNNNNNNIYEPKIIKKDKKNVDFQNSNKDIDINDINDINKTKSNKEINFDNKNNYNNYKDIDLNSNNNININFINNNNENDEYLNLNEKNKNDNKLELNNDYENEYNINKKPKDIKIYNYSSTERRRDKYNIGNNNDKDSNILNDSKNISLQREINQLKNENNYKDFLINDLRNQLEQKNKKDEKNENINNNQYNNLIKELENKNNYIQKLENDVKNLKFKIDNLIIENKKIKGEKDNILSQKDELKAETDINKIDLLNNIDKLNKLEKMNKKLNKDYLSLSNDYKIIKEEKEKLKSIIDEQNATIFNYEKQLNSNSKPSNQRYIKTNNSNEKININHCFSCNDRNYNPIDYDVSDKYNYSNEKKDIRNSNKSEKDKYRTLSCEKNEKYENDNLIFNNYNYDNFMPMNNTNINTRLQRSKYLDNIQKNKYSLDSNIGDDFKGRKYDYNINANYKNNDNNDMLGYIAEKNKKIKKGELNYLENYLSSLLKERSQLEKDLSEIPEHPRTLKDIKLKNSIKDKITQNDREMINIQQQLKKLRGN